MSARINARVSALVLMVGLALLVFASFAYAQEVAGDIVISDAVITSTFDESAPAPVEEVSVTEEVAPTEETSAPPVEEAAPAEETTVSEESAPTEEVTPTDETATTPEPDSTPIVIEEVGTTSTIDEASAETPADTSTSEPSPVIEEVAPAAVASAPVLSTDQADYAPGSLATIFGKFFNALQNVVLTIVGVATDGSEATTATWDVTADDVGSFITTYQLPNVFIPLYLLAANATTGETLAETSFTDGNVKVHGAPSGATFTLTKTIYSSSTDCSTGGGAPTAVTGVGFSGGAIDTSGVGNTESVKLVATATSDQGGAFINWTTSDGGMTPATGTTQLDVCVVGFSGGGSRDYYANYSASSLSSTITGKKFEDTDADGSTRETEEPYLAGWAMRLYNTATSPWTLVDTQVTDATGSYSFTGLSVGSYKVCEVLQDDWTQTFASSEGTNSSPDASEEGQWCITRNITTPGSNPDAANFGNYEKTDPTLSVTNSPQTYNGSAQAANVTGSVVGAVSDVKYDGSTTAPTNAGTYAVTADFAPTNTTLYNSLNDASAGNFVITQAPSVTIVTCSAPVVYNGSAQEPCTASVTGVGGLNLTPAPSYSNNTNAGTATASYTYAGDANHTGSSDSEDFTISKADATCTISNYSDTYDGAAHSASGTCTGVGGPLDILSGLDLGSSFTDVPGGTAIWTFTGGTNYLDENGTAAIVINPATATIVVDGYTGVYDALPHGATLVSATGVGGADLNASVNLGGETFVNVPGGTATWSFANPNYVPQNGTAPIVITKAPSATTVTCPVAVVYDGLAQEPCLASVTGAGGLDQTLTVSYTDNTDPGTATASASYIGDDNHNGSSDSTTFTIYSLVPLSDLMLTAYNLIGTSHTLSVTLDPEDEGIPVLFEIVDGPNSSQTDTILTGPGGVATFIYTDTSGGGVDTIKACVNLDESLVTCTGNQSTVTQTKYWLTKFLTGGGNVRVGKGNNSLLWTFGGNVGLAGDNTPVGQFQVLDHNGFGYHFNNILSVALTGLQTFTFTAEGWTQGSTKAPVTATITVFDGNVGGRDKGDKIGVTITDPAGLVVIPTTPTLTPLTGGNLKVFVR